MSVQDKFGTAIILAGGKSSRMGFDKQFLTIGDNRIMDIVISKLLEEFSDIIIVTNKPEEYSDEKYDKHKIVSDIIAGKGPLSGLHVGLKNAKSEYAFFIACDMPNINLDFIRYMKKKIIETSPDACVAETDEHIEAFNSFYSSDIVSTIEKQLQNDKRSVYSLLKTVTTFYISEDVTLKFSKDFDMFKNLNTPKELEEYQSDKK